MKIKVTTQIVGDYLVTKITKGGVTKTTRVRLRR